MVSNRASGQAREKPLEDAWEDELDDDDDDAAQSDGVCVIRVAM